MSDKELQQCFLCVVFLEESLRIIYQDFISGQLIHSALHNDTYGEEKKALSCGFSGRHILERRT